MFEYTSLGFCAWDIPALIVLIVIVVIFAVHRNNQKKREKEFEDRLASELAEETLKERI